MSETKNRLNPPVFPDSVMERPEVNSAIDAAMKKNIVYMHAPAGFGKTIAMSMWLSSRKALAAWIPLTVYDDEPAIFCRYLLTALVELNSDAAGAAKAALDDSGFTDAPFEYFFRAVSSMSGESGQGIIILDDFHLIENPAILSTLPLMVKKLFQVHKLALLSRLAPPMAFSDLAIKDQMGELNEHDLRFTKKQIVELYRGFGVSLRSEEAAAVEQKTGGWALGLRAELLTIKTQGSESFLSQASEEKYIDGYLTSEIWDKWDDRTKEFLLRTSLLEDLPPELCDSMCSCDSEKLLAQLMNDSGLAIRLPNGSFRYHHILRDFLRRTAAREEIDLTSYYIASADYMFANGKLNAAFDYYMKSGDRSAIVSFLTKIVDYGATTGSVEEYYHSITSFLVDKLPVEIVEDNPSILAPCVWASLLSGNIERFQYWLTKLQVYFDVDKESINPRIMAAITLFQFPNPLNSPRNILEYASEKLDPTTLESVPAPSITYNFPFFHRGHRDYSDLTGEWEELVPKYIAAFNTISNNAISLVMDGVVSGLLYEQNKLPQAKEKAIKVLGQLDESSHPELWFSAQMHLAGIAFAEADEESAWDSIYKAQSIIEQRGLYLLKNLNAVKTNYQLLMGNHEAALEWLSRYATNDSTGIRLYELYQVITTIRSRIAIGDFAAALVLMARIEKLVLDYRRPLDQMELHILRAIVFWNEKLRAEAVTSMEKAVLLARPYGFIRIFADEGAVVIPILQKLYNRLASRPEQSETAIFVRTVLLLTSESAQMNPGLTSNLEENSVKLSKQQKRMLLFLAAGKNNRQICEETGLKLNTVKAHLYKLYEKLEVHSSTEAVLKSYRLGIIEKNMP